MGCPRRCSGTCDRRPAHTNFTLRAVGAFVFAGVAAGVALTGACATNRDERRLQCGVALLAVRWAAVAYWASLQPSIYPPGRSTFWGASPTFFFIRLGIVAALLPLAWSLRRHLPGAIGAPLATLGAASLFVYWVHVEVVYGGLAILLKRRLPFELTLVGHLAVGCGLTRLVPWARRWVAAPTRRRCAMQRLVARLL